MYVMFNNNNNFEQHFLPQIFYIKFYPFPISKLAFSFAENNFKYMGMISYQKMRTVKIELY